MNFERKIYNQLLDWKEKTNGKSAILIEGARRVGKSTVAEEFAKNEYDDYILLDFSKETKDVRKNFEDNIRKNYCGTPLPDGTYTFSNSIGDKAIVPAKFGGQPYTVFNNGWTGTPGSIASGSITIEGTQVTFDLYVQTGNGDNLIHVTGSPALSLQAVRNYASRASLLTL